MKTFLVPLDFSAVSGGIVDAAIGFARAFGGKVVLLHTIQSPIVTSEYALPVEAVQEMLAANEKAASVKLARHVEHCREAGLEVASLVRLGPPVAEILAEAEKIKADYIIMGSHGHGKIYDLLVGSTASGVLQGARCGVIIMPHEKKRG